MRVQEILKTKGSDVVTVLPADTIRFVAKVLATRRIGAAVVVEGQQVVGVLSERDIVRGIAEHGEEALTLKARDLMSKDVIVCGVDDTIRELMATMTNKRIRHLPVMKGADLIGIVSIGDVVKNRVEETETEANVLRDYVMAR